MTQERRTPLPVGLYWIDMYDPPVGGASIPAFQQWLKENASVVAVRKTVYHGPGADPFVAFARGAWTLSPALAAVANAIKDDGTSRAWILFEVLQADQAHWPGKEFGFPSIAPKGSATDEADTRDREDPEKDFPDRVPDILEEVGNVLSKGGTIAVVALVLAVGVAGYSIANRR